MAHVAVFVDVIPRRLLGDVRELDGEALAQQLVDQRLNTAWVVVPPPSVHVGGIFQRDRLVVAVNLMESVEHVSLLVGAGHGGWEEGTCACVSTGCTVSKRFVAARCREKRAFARW